MEHILGVWEFGEIRHTLSRYCVDIAVSSPLANGGVTVPGSNKNYKLYRSIFVLRITLVKMRVKLKDNTKECEKAYYKIF